MSAARISPRTSVPSSKAHLFLTALFCVVLASCGASNVPRETIVVKTEVHIVRGDDRERLGVHPDEERIAVAANALEKALGRAVAIEVDAALLPSTKSGVVLQTADSHEAMAK
ncbi:MAG: hypothetical protein ABW133_12585 [Polyangiaceae bacterium]